LQPYIKKHIGNFLRDVAERAALGVGAIASSGGNRQPISEGTLMFNAAALRVAGGDTDAVSKIVSAQVGCCPCFGRNTVSCCCRSHAHI
jgi:hypothetical protein